MSVASLRGTTALLMLTFAACTTDQMIQRPDGSREFIVACGAAVGWNVCHRRAAELCPTGYDTIQQGNDGNRKELVIACPAPGARAAAANGMHAQCRYEAALATVSLSRDREAAETRLADQCIAARGRP